jgi:putative transposase
MAMDQSALLELLEALKAAGVDDRDPARGAEHVSGVDRRGGRGRDRRRASGSALLSPHGGPERVASRTLSTTAGDLELRIPKLRTGSFFPSLLERRRRIDQALFAVVMEAYLHGVSTRKVDDLVKALGADTGISKSEVSGSARTSTPRSPRSATGP